MSLKTLYGLQSALLATSRPAGELWLDYSKIVEDSQAKNKTHLETYKDLVNSATSEPNLRKELVLPVNLIIYDKYYEKISEWKYLDKYQYDQEILVFDKKGYDPQKINQIGAYKKNWLNNLTHLKNYHYLWTSVYKFPQKDDAQNINWIDGEASGQTLKNLLSLNLPKPEDIKGSFEIHKKIIELDQSFLMSPIISLFSGYWKKGELNKANNVISKVNYGKLKPDSVLWSDLYHYERNKKRDCSELEHNEDDELRVIRKEMSEGFDSQCGRISLLNYNSFFKRHQNRRIYSSGVVGYKRLHPAYWTTHTYFYSLGDWNLDKPSKYQVNREGTDQSLWYVDFDKLFVPEIQLVKEPVKGNFEKKQFQLSFYLDYKKIDNVEAFLKISTKLKFKLKFKYRAKDYEQLFTISEVLNDKKFYFEDHWKYWKSNTGAFSNFELLVFSDNPNIKLQTPENKKEFSYKLNLSIVESRFNILYGLLLDQEELKDMYYSELKNKEKLQKFFYLINKSVREPRVRLINLSSEWTESLKVKLIGMDYSSSATLEYYDFFEGRTKKVELSNLLMLPSFDREKYVKKDHSTSIEKLIGEQNSHKIGSYFWSKMKLQLKEKDLFNGIEKYTLQPKNQRDPDIEDLKDYYKDIEIVVQGENTHYLVRNEAQSFDKSINSSTYHRLFSISDNGKEEVGINLSDFNFRKVFEDNNEIEIEVEYKGNRGTKLVNVQNMVYEGVVLTGKTNFKFNKNQISPESEDFWNKRSSSRYSSYSNKSSGSSWGETSSFLPALIGGTGIGAGLLAGAGSLLLKKFKIALS
ncbi:hypothetical protein WEN_00675 [Mycoplasma wenyonii str. Massachusetts]|uniref:Uncharacterized protein n=1 Tax=Mycoplasma wenyonii (strain Massachusetts) TaxID=1197325 RepID=I6ZID8_MYCWM|nr:hypothetical protein [Mycoplasma wenyonii]AFN64940.1 hypothetical protein WEN_00675 [Mycoplasma wenyonii str. Massachusetts]